MNPSEQLTQWVNGNPIHNDEREECTPDFSCCRGKEYMADKQVRERFAKAYRENDESTTNALSGMFLGAALSDIKANVYISGDGAVSSSPH